MFDTTLERTDAPEGRTGYIRSFEAIACWAVALLLAACFLATLIVIFSDIPPVFNQRVAIYHALNLACLCAIAILLASMAASTFVERLQPIRRAIVLVALSLMTLESLLFAFDNLVVSVAGSTVKEASYNVSTHGESIYLQQPTPTSPYGFRTPNTPPLDAAGRRILFLGNSYVKGSGSSFATNYTQAVGADLNKPLPAQHFSVFSAGVNGYGVRDDRVLYQYLLDKNYKFDVVVMNFMMGSDPTNDIPGTIRRAMAGQPQRLHEEWFIRTFYPFNSYLFRYLTYFDVTFNQKWSDTNGPHPKDANCTMSKSFADFSRERANYYYGAGAQKRLYIDYNMDEMFKLADMVKAHGAQFLVVLLPDPNALLPPNHAYFAQRVMDWDWSRHAMTNQIAQKFPMLDLSPDFTGRSDLFRCNDTHWNDKGNLEGARLVADFLAHALYLK